MTKLYNNVVNQKNKIIEVKKKNIAKWGVGDSSLVERHHDNALSNSFFKMKHRRKYYLTVNQEFT